MGRNRSMTPGGTGFTYGANATAMLARDPSPDVTPKVGYFNQV